MNLRYCSLHCAIFMVFLLSACSSAEPAAKTPENSGTVMAVTVTRVREGTLRNTLDVHGKAVPREDVSVATDLGGIAIVEVNGEEGDTVKKGQVLVRLDTAALRYTLDSLEAELAKAVKETGRARVLAKAAAMSKEEEERREAAYLTLRAQVADARLRLRKAVVAAPAGGRIYRRDATIGAITKTEQPFFRIAAGGEIELEVTVPEAFVHAITLETPVEAALVGDQEKKPARIRVIAPRIDQATRTANVRLTFPASSVIPVHTFCTARFSLPARKGLLVESTAVQQDVQGTYVWVVRDDNTVLRRNVTVTARNGSEVLIEGVENNQAVVARAGAFLQEGDRVQRSGEVQ